MYWMPFVTDEQLKLNLWLHFCQLPSNFQGPWVEPLTLTKFAFNKFLWLLCFSWYFWKYKIWINLNFGVENLLYCRFCQIFNICTPFPRYFTKKFKCNFLEISCKLIFLDSSVLKNYFQVQSLADHRLSR